MVNLTNFTFLIGELLFGISVIRAGVYSKIAAILFMLGLVTVALHPTGIFPESVVDIGATGVGIGLIWWSLELNRLAIKVLSGIVCSSSS